MWESMLVEIPAEFSPVEPDHLQLYQSWRWQVKGKRKTVTVAVTIYLSGQLDSIFKKSSKVRQLINSTRSAQGHKAAT